MVSARGEMDINGGHVQAILLTSTKAIKWCLQGGRWI